ncbi:MAG: hypothetical protein ACI9T7_003141 [Oleiphilaceae bacterium]|jgi:hypothetical protein
MTLSVSGHSAKLKGFLKNVIDEQQTELNRKI